MLNREKFTVCLFARLNSSLLTDKVVGPPSVNVTKVSSLPLCKMSVIS